MDTNAMNNQFSSLHYNLTTSETQFVEEESGDAMAHPACDSCQAQKLRCDGQTAGCFRYKASSAACSYNNSSRKRGPQPKHNAHRPTRSKKGTYSQTEKAPDRMPNNSSQGHDASGFDVNYPNMIENIHETVGNFIPNQQPFTDLTSSSTRLDPIISSTDSTSLLIPQFPLENDSVSTHPTSASDNVLTLPTFEPELSPNTSIQTRCGCPEAMFVLLERSQCRSCISIQTTHFNLAYVRVALEGCTRTLDCNLCNRRTDHMMLPVVIINKLVSILEEVVHAYNRRRAFLSSSTVPLDQQQQRDASPHHYNHHQDNINYNVFIGDYAINSEVELEAVMTALTVVLVQGALSLVRRLKGVARAKGRDTQLQMLSLSEQRAKKIAGSMQDVAGAGTGG